MSSQDELDAAKQVLDECMNCGSRKREDRSYVDIGIKCTHPWHQSGNTLPQQNDSSSSSIIEAVNRAVAYCQPFPWREENFRFAVTRAINEVLNSPEGTE